MKLPLPQRPFAPLQLSRAQCDDYERLAMDVVRECVDEFDDFVDRQQRRLDPRLWKAVKSKDNVAVYKQLEDTASGAAHGTTRASVSSTWSTPKLLLGVGSVVGNFDDILYGVLSPDVTSMQVNTAYTKDEIVDCDVLETIRSGTHEDPLRFVGIKWLAKSTPYHSVVWPRDVTIVDATGVYVDVKGQRYGYHVMHSVDLPQCPSLAHLGIVRGKMSSCFLFKSRRDDRSVDIFMTSLVEPGGNLRAAAAIPSAVNSLLGFAEAVYTAEKKKLAWLLTQSLLAARAHARRRGIGGIHIPIKTDDKGRQCCALCIRPFSTFRSRVGCELCHSVVCSRCETTRKIASVEGRHVTIETRPVCKICITTASSMDAADFARCEYVPGGVECSHQEEQNHDHRKSWRAAENNRLSSLAATERSSGVTTVSSRSSISETPWAQSESSETHALVVRRTLTRRPPPPPPPPPASRPPSPTPTRRPPPSPAPIPSIPLQSQRKKLWLQMHQLRVQAEQAAQNNHARAESTDRRPRPWGHN